MTRRQLRLALAAVGGNDVRSGLEAVGLLSIWLAEREEALVLKARGKGWSWGQVAEPLGRSRQAVWERFRSVDQGVRK